MSLNMLSYTLEKAKDVLNLKTSFNHDINMPMVCLVHICAQTLSVYLHISSLSTIQLLQSVLQRAFSALKSIHILSLILLLQSSKTIVYGHHVKEHPWIV